MSLSACAFVVVTGCYAQLKPETVAKISAALACSDIPFECPISEVRVARINGEYVINPTFQQMDDADMDIMVGASAENIMMVEGEMKEEPRG